MLNLNRQLKFSYFTGIYDAIIHKNHLLRKIAEHIDFSFVNKLMEECYCIDFGSSLLERYMDNASEVYRNVILS